MLRLCEFYPGICLTTEEKARKNLSQGKMKNVAEPGRPQMTIWRMCNACWMPKATDAHSECVTLVAFPLQQWLYERRTMLRYTYSTLPVSLL